MAKNIITGGNTARKTRSKKAKREDPINLKVS